MKLLFRWMLKATCIVMLVSVLGLLAPVWAQCPSDDKVKEGFQKISKRGAEVKVIKVQKSALPSLCEVQMNVGGQNDVFYTDSEGKYFIRGPLYDAQNGLNLTQQVITQLNRLSAEEMKRLESLVAFTAGTSPKVVYYITDPQCPYCVRGLTILKTLIDQEKLTVKFVLYPLPMHAGAEEQCVAIICDSKGLDGLESKYQSENQCPGGQEKVREAIAFIKGKGITGTPAYVFEDGTYHVGVMQQEALLKK